MILNCDSHYQIGNGHTYCQDYALHGDLDGFRWGLISDGCSGSPFTDVGARLIVRNADALIRKHIQDRNVDYLRISDEKVARSFVHSIFFDKFGLGCNSIINSLSLPETALDATLWMVFCENTTTPDKSYRFHVMGFGDGQAIIRSRYQMSTEIYYMFYPSGAPFYPTYNFSLNKQTQYVERFGTFCRHGYMITSEQGETVQSECDAKYDHAVCFYTEANSVTVTTDGFRTYGLKPEQQQDCLKWASTRLVNFKSIEGVFVQRRMKALARQDAKENIGHFDDIAAASIIVVEENNSSLKT